MRAWTLRFETQDLSWSKDYENVNDDSSDDEYHDKEIENLLTDAKSLVRGSLNGDGIVTEGKLDIRRMVDANITDPSPSNERVTVTKFHPNGDCLMVGSTDKYLRFFKVDGERCKETQTLKLQVDTSYKLSFEFRPSKEVRYVK